MKYFRLFLKFWQEIVLSASIVGICVYLIIFQYTHDELTQTQLVKENWELEVLNMGLAFLLQLKLNKN